MAWVKASNGNVFEVEDIKHLEKILREAPVDKAGKPLTTAWDNDPRGDAKPKPWVQPEDEAPSE